MYNLQGVLKVSSRAVSSRVHPFLPEVFGLFDVMHL
jgi:hypothetical protein